MSIGDKIGAAIGIAMALALVGLIVWAIAGTARNIREEKAALAACWECGWGRIEYVHPEYRCVIMEDGAESVRTIAWVRENACDVLER